jgi:exodeoxyribonuclease VII small subunit
MPKKTKTQPITDLTFEQAFAELEESVRTLERGELPLEESLALYERGQELAAYCAKLLDEAELKITQVEGN